MVLSHMVDSPGRLHVHDPANLAGARPLVVVIGLLRDLVVLPDEAPFTPSGYFLLCRVKIWGVTPPKFDGFSNQKMAEVA